MFDTEASSLTSFLKTLPSKEIVGLYKNQWTCQAVFRSLPSVARQYVLRMLFVNQPIPQYVIESWSQPQHASKHRETMQIQEDLQLLEYSEDESGEVMLMLHHSFQKNLRLAVSGGGAMHASVPPEVAKKQPSKKALDAYAEEQWEALLLFLVGSRRSPPQAPDLLREKTPMPFGTLLEGAGLLNEGSKNGRGSISELGFRFLLMDVSSQMWKLMAQYVKETEEAMGSSLIEVVSFLLELAFRPISQPGRIAELNAVQCQVAHHMAQLGVMMLFEVACEIWYVPTRLAACLCSSANVGIEIGQHGGYIVVETNYRLYGYTSSPIHRSILELFTRCECVLPNLYVGVLTRDSVAHSLECGIVADQIVSYLQSHAHPKIRSRVPVVPEVVADQIRLWEKDINRVQPVDAFMYDEFPSTEVFQKAVKYAQSIGMYLWDDGRSKIFARSEGCECASRICTEQLDMSSVCE